MTIDLVEDISAMIADRCKHTAEAWEDIAKKRNIHLIPTREQMAQINRLMRFILTDKPASRNARRGLVETSDYKEWLETYEDYVIDYIVDNKCLEVVR